MGLVRRLCARARGLWNGIRAVMGDNAYERHLEASARLGATPLSAEAFYLDSVERRYSTLNRCC
jgi:Selenoprotein, putative